MTQLAPPKSKLIWLVIAIVIAVAIVLFLTFRPVSQTEAMVQDDGEPKVYEPVVYDTHDWQTLAITNKPMDELLVELGSTATKEDALDYYGNQATRYRYSAGHEPPLYSIQSDGLMEIVWYYPAPTDDDKTKAQAVAFAKRVYRMMGGLAGEAGTQVVTNMLQAKPVTEQQLGRAHLLQARCQEYQCRIILAK